MKIRNRKLFVSFMLIAVIIASCCIKVCFSALYVQEEETTESSSTTSPLQEEEEKENDVISLKSNQPVKEIPSSSTEIEKHIPELDVDAEEVEEDETSSRIHIVESGDSWWNIAEFYYADGSIYEELASYNNASSSSLSVGQVIELPVAINGILLNIEKIKEYDEEDIPVDEIEESSLFNIATTMLAGSYNNSGYQYGVRTSPKVDITIPTGDVMKNFTGEVDTSSFTFYSNMSITGYNPTCVHCTGSTAGIGASGVEMIPGYSVAAPAGIPLGTTIYIEGYGFYVVEDRGGFGNYVIDIACPTDESCAFVTDGTGSVAVYIVG